MKKLFFVFLIIFFSILSVTSVFAFSAGVVIPEKYADVVAGEHFYFEVDIKYPENPSREDLRFEYEILNQDDERIGSSKVLKAIETQISFIDSILIPESAKKGLHIINVIIRDYGSLEEGIQASFYVVVGDVVLTKVYFFIILGAILFVGVLVGINIFVTMRKK